MWQNLLLAFGAVLPFMVFLALGYFAVRAKLSDESFMDKLNKFTFKLFFPLLMFKNVYSASADSTPSLKLIIVAVVGVIALLVLLWFTVPRVVKENPRRGVIIQALFRGNFLLYGIPLITNVFGEERASITGFMSLIVISLFNVMAVVVLESFNEKGAGGLKIGKLLLNLVKNPLLQGCFAGLIFFFLKIKLPDVVYSPIRTLGDMATPLGMITLGGTLKFKSFGKNRRAIISVTALRLVALPLVMTAIAYLVGLRGAELFMITVIFGTPVAVASYPMAVNMGGDGELAGQLVFVTTLVSLVTIFLFIFSMAQLGLLV